MNSTCSCVLDLTLLCRFEGFAPEILPSLLHHHYFFCRIIHIERKHSNYFHSQLHFSRLLGGTVSCVFVRTSFRSRAFHVILKQFALGVGPSPSTESNLIEESVISYPLHPRLFNLTKGFGFLFLKHVPHLPSETLGSLFLFMSLISPF